MSGIVSDFGDRTRYPELSIAFLLPYDKLSVVARDWPGTQDYAKAHRGFVFAGPRGKPGKAYILAGRDEKTVLELIQKLVAIWVTVGAGLLLTVKQTASADLPP